jgi:putative nucleotidyltransferase with HDIG domain
MDIKRIEKLEREIKDLHLKPKHNKHSLTKKNMAETFGLFWFIHLKPVIDYSKELAKKYNANLEVVWLSAILHDLARLDDLEPHDEISAERAYDMLLEKRFSKEIAEEVKKTILTHRCKKHKPQTLEQKILATADAMSHFKTPFYFWFSSISSKPLKEQLEGSLQKIERDYNEKIFFEDEKESVKKEYEVLKNWFEYYSKIIKI